MSWKTRAMKKLEAGEEVTVRPSGNSMKGRVGHKDYVTLAPCDPRELCVGDVVLARVKGTVYLHLLVAVQGKRFLIGNNKGGLNGWTTEEKIYGRAVRISRSRASKVARA